MLPNFLGRDYAGGQLHTTSESTKIDFQNDCSAEWFHWHFAEEADGRSGITQSPKLTIFLAQILWLPRHTSSPPTLITLPLWLQQTNWKKSKPENIKQRKTLMTGQNNNHFLALGHALGEPWFILPRAYQLNEVSRARTMRHMAH